MKYARWLVGILPIMLLGSAAWGAERAALVREAIIYLSPDVNSSKLGNAERGRELVVLENTRGWIHVEALLGPAQTPDAAIIEEEEGSEKTVTGWVQDKGVVRASTPKGDEILYGEAADSE